MNLKQKVNYFYYAYLLPLLEICEKEEIKTEAKTAVTKALKLIIETFETMFDKEIATMEKEENGSSN